ncbi:PREDICTED: uncharacterized protein LOC105110869 isoform X4 [Populus euphratica]|uniref:Uncharacterized protein LOC105110869 isoform X4 n=1 Tax=Populus euphratica TaxID=75702 RepID=A0AAJ6X3T7_POPEU|nr:PREDICTED: uncharacterized protein LOC105110869 isoform X4 [Populus euphratica]
MVAVVPVDSLPLGFRFRPTDEELISHYLRLKINGRDSEVEVIPEIDICKLEPWDLPGLSVIKTDDPEWFFFCPRDRKYPNGHRSNRATNAGYWKATGKDRTIKSRKSAGNTTLIGMKKTLVFYRGRAPKGERTNWIMHEYRPTEKDLNGTGPGQGAFVLFRLFRKPEERPSIVKYDEMEQIEYSPTAAKSSPDDASSDLVQETATSEMSSGRQPEDIKMWSAESDNTTSNAVVPIDSCSNSRATSDVEDQVPEATAVEAYLPLDEISPLHEPVSDELDCKIFSPMRSQIPADLGCYMDSPYASDFGNNQNGFSFQGGTSEQDVSFIELLDDYINNHGDYSGEETSSQNTLGVGSETQLFGQVPPGNFHVKDHGIYNGMAQELHASHMGAPVWPGDQFDSYELLQMQTAFGTCQAPTSFSDGEIGRGNIGHFGNNFVGQDAPFANSAISSFDVYNTMEEPTSQMTSVDYDSGVSGTGIKIRTRQPQVRRHSDNLVDQGSAPRRIRLLVERSVESVGNCKVNDATHVDDEDEVQSAVTEATGDAGKQASTVDEDEDEDEVQSAVTEATGDAEKQASAVDDLQNESTLAISKINKEITEESSSNLRLRVKREGDSGSRQIALPASPAAPPAHHGHKSLSIYVSIFLLLILFIAFAGMWRSRKTVKFLWIQDGASDNL